MSLTGQVPSSTSNIQLIIDALADYAKVTGIDLSNNPFSAALERSTSPEAILQLLQGREKAFKEYRDDNRRLISCLRPAVTVLQAFSGTLGEAFSLIPPAGALFAGIDFLLEAASGVTSSYDALLDLFECLGNFLKRLEIYTTIPPTPIMTDIIVKIMVELLSVLALATKQIKQGRFKKFAKKLLGDSEIEAILRRLDRLTEDEARMTLAQTLGVVYGLVGNMKIVMEDGKASTDSIRQDLVSLHQVLNEINKMKRDQLRWEVQQWLSPPDPSTNHNFVRKSRQSGTAAWFFEGNALTEWKARGSLLWIHGKPGAGKSTLLSAVVQDIERMHAAGLATMAYYYFDFRDVKKQDCYGLLSSIISQLSAESDSCFNIFSQLYSDNTRGVRKPDLDALKNCLTDMLSLSGQGPVYIIIDAVDECPNVSGTPSPREEVLELLEGLVDLELRNLHLCVASRPEIDIRQVLEPLTSLRISLHDESGQKEDIIAYIKSVVHSDRRMRKWREEDQNLVIDTLSQNADGMFRWVVCQVDELRRCFPASIRSALADLPESLDKTYERTLLGIDKQKRKYAQRLFQCLSVSIRPLRVDELAEIFAVQFDTTAPPSFNENFRPPDAEEAVLSACSSLIAVVNREGSQVVQFSHFSVKEFLTSNRLATTDERLSYYHILPEPAHTLLAHAGLSVLLRLDDKTDRNTITQFPLAPYAARHWVDHARFRNVSSHIEEVMERLFDPATPHFVAWVWLYDIDHDWVDPQSSMHPTKPEAVPLYYAALCGFGNFVRRLLISHSADINSRGGSHTTPLHAAALKGHVEVTSVLLESGADPNSQDDLGRAPLHRVSQGGDLLMERSSVEITRLLINSGANVNVTDDEGWTPLHAAAQNGYREIAQHLLASGATLDAQNQYQETPLHLSCANGKLQVSRLLIDCGLDLKSRDSDGFSPLHMASANGHLDLVKLLIDHGANVDSRSDKDETPLDSAAAYGYLDIVRFLIKSGAAASARDKNGWTPFHSASNFGHLHIMKLFLLECGIDVDIRSGSEETSLYLASSPGELDAVRFLIERGADIHAGNNKGWNPLHIASQKGHLDVVRMLINAGVAVDIQNGAQETPLALASNDGKEDVGRFLIERGADVNARDSQCSTPLHFASQHGHLDMARLLLDNGADANVQQEDLRSPLHLASAHGHLKVVDLLVQRGADVDVLNDKQQTPLDHAAGNGKVAIARLLIDLGANLHSTDSRGWTPLHAASYGGHLGVIKLLLKCGADVNSVDKANKTGAVLASENGKIDVARLIAGYKANADIRNKIRSTTLDKAEYGTDEDENDEGMASLHDAAEGGDINVVKSLLERGVDINARNANTETPLSRAAAEGNFDVVRLLVDRGAEVNSRDMWSWTPLHLASRFGHLKVVKLLLEHGAHVHALNGDGQTPFQVSAQREIADLLREHGA